MTTIYLIRHAEAEGNLYRRVQGHFNGQITQQGHRQIAALAERFRDVQIDALYSSDLDRTVTTAGAILKYHDLPHVKTPRLREVHMGWWEGKPWGNVQEKEPEQMQYFSNDPANWIVEGNEHFDVLTDRMVSAIRDIAAENEGKTVAVVSHGMAIRALLANTLGIASADIKNIPHGDNTAVSKLRVENGVITADFVNDNSHLDSSISTFAKQTWWKHKSGTDPNNMSLYPMDPSEEKKLYIDCYRDAWISVHGDALDFNGSFYWKRAIEHHKAHPEAVMKAYAGPDFAGLVDLDPQHSAEEGVGWISLCYLRPEFRGQHLGVQLIGHAIVTYRDLGRKVLRLNVSKKNTTAIGFYTRFGFKDITPGRGDQRTMELVL